MELNALTALSPLDGRYATKTVPLRELCSEYGLIRSRILIEIRWLQHLSRQSDIPEVPTFSAEDHHFLEMLHTQFSLQDAQQIKQWEQTTNHDVKAVEYYLRERFQSRETLSRSVEFLHFACTSEDINNLCYALLLQQARDLFLQPLLFELHQLLVQRASDYQEIPMLSRTHGQAASPTTVGKEWINVAARLEQQLDMFASLPILGKFNGAVGNYNAHTSAYPEVDWLQVSTDFIHGLGLSSNVYTTQIEPHDNTAAWCHCLSRINTILLDFGRDMWAYISLGYYKQKIREGEVGSSTMPHKVNPIDFENAEGNLGLANAMLQFFANKLPISRWQRDLSDSTVQRNFGVAIGYSYIAYLSMQAGIEKVELDPIRLQEDLQQAWEILAEPIQTVMRRYGIPHPYETLKQFTRGKTMTPESIRDFVQQLNIPDEAKSYLLSLTPDSYTGWATRLTQQYIQCHPPHTKHHPG